MIQLTAHFVLEEFTLSSTALSLGIENKPTPEHMPNPQKLAEQMEKVRALFNVSEVRLFRQSCHPERSEGPLEQQERSLAALGMTGSLSQA